MLKGRPKRFRVRKDVRLPYFPNIYNKEKGAIKADTGRAEISHDSEGETEKTLHKKRHSEGSRSKKEILQIAHMCGRSANRRKIADVFGRQRIR